MTKTMVATSRPAYQAYLLIPGYLNVALRDFGLMLGALALARLGKAFGEGAAR